MKALQKRTFISPSINPLVVLLVRLMMPFMMKKLCGGLQVQISPENLAKLRQYQGQRMLLLPNHPTGEEPQILFDIGQRMSEVFNFVAAREVFDWEHGFRGWVLRRVGTYSVIRGAVDRESFMMSKKILMEGKNRLVIFIEGEISRENDTLIPFEPGVIQLAYWSQEALAKEARANNTSGEVDFPAVYIAPIAIKYFYHSGVDTAIENSLRSLEKAVGLHPLPPSNRYERIRAIGERVITVQEAMHQMVAHPETTMTERVDAIKNRMLKKMELFLDLRPDPTASTISRLREIRNTMDRLVHSYDDPTDMTDYEKRVVEHFRTALSEFYTDLDRVAYFLTYDESYLRDNQTQEHLIEMLLRLEKEVFGATRLSHPRTAVVEVGDVLNLKECFAEYEADKKGFVKQLAHRLEDDMMTMLSSIQRPEGL